MASVVEIPAVLAYHRLLSETSVAAGHLEDLLTAIRLEKRSGRLEIHFSQGSPSGTVKFIEHRKDVEV